LIEIPAYGALLPRFPYQACDTTGLLPCTSCGSPTETPVIHPRLRNRRQPAWSLPVRRKDAPEPDDHRVKPGLPLSHRHASREHAALQPARGRRPGDARRRGACGRSSEEGAYLFQVEPHLGLVRPDYTLVVWNGVASFEGRSTAGDSPARLEDARELERAFLGSNQEIADPRRRGKSTAVFAEQPAWAGPAGRRFLWRRYLRQPSPALSLSPLA